MSVNHTIGMGIGYIVWPDEIEDADGDPVETIEKTLKHYDGLGYFVAGSYLGDDPIEYGIMVSRTYEGCDDLTGFMDLDRGTWNITQEERDALRDAVEDLTGNRPVDAARLLVGGLWS